MNINQEVELKLELDPADMKLLLGDWGADGAMTSSEQHSVYFDTDDGDLHKAGLSLRVRQIGDRRIQTVKASANAAAGLFSRDEWEREIASNVPELDGGLADLIHSRVGHDIGPLRPLFATSVVRSSRCQVKDGASIEMVADFGSVFAGERNAPICEIEMELRAGEPAALFALARKLDAHVALRLGVRTKSERGYRLAAGKQAAPVKAELVALAEEMNAAAVFQTIAGGCIRHFRLNEDLVISAGDAEAVHQARVALRRLRTAISIFKPMLARPQTLWLGGEIKWIMGLLGEVRNLDVVIERSDEPALRRRLRVARRRAIGEAVEALESRRFRQLMIDLAEWIAVGGWLDTSPAELREQPAREMAGEVMERLWRRLRRKGRHLTALDEESLHNVRILAKKARYAAEFFSDLLPRARARKLRKAFLAALEDLQSHLGHLNDGSVARGVFEKLDVAADIPVVSADEHAALLARAEKAYDELAGMKLFWR